MKKITLLLLTLFSLTSCHTVRSSLNFTEGTSLIDKGEYQAAIPYLEKAVALDPDFARNRTNLAYAYWKTGAERAAWNEIRSAVLCKHQDGLSHTTFRAIFQGYVTARGLDQPGVPEEKLLDELGPPDLMISASDGSFQEWLYGACFFKFNEDKLQEVVFF